MALDQKQNLTDGFYNHQETEQVYDDFNPVSPPIQISAASAKYEVQLGQAAEPIVDIQKPPRGTITGSMVGAICGCLVGLGILAVPGIGPVVAVGTTATTLIMTLAGTGIGVACGGLIDALFVEAAAD